MCALSGLHLKLSDDTDTNGDIGYWAQKAISDFLNYLKRDQQLVFYYVFCLHDNAMKFILIWLNFTV